MRRSLEQIRLLQSMVFAQNRSGTVVFAKNSLVMKLIPLMSRQDFSCQSQCAMQSCYFLHFLDIAGKIGSSGSNANLFWVKTRGHSAKRCVLPVSTGKETGKTHLSVLHCTVPSGFHPKQICSATKEPILPAMSKKCKK